MTKSTVNSNPEQVKNAKFLFSKYTFCDLHSAESKYYGSINSFIYRDKPSALNSVCRAHAKRYQREMHVPYVLHVPDVPDVSGVTNA